MYGSRLSSLSVSMELSYSYNLGLPLGVLVGVLAILVLRARSLDVVFFSLKFVTCVGNLG